jgi:aspartate-semialdehyde dehydrogenase
MKVATFLSTAHKGLLISAANCHVSQLIVALEAVRDPVKYVHV